MCQEAKRCSLSPVHTEASRGGIRGSSNPPAWAGSPRTGLHRAMCSQVLGTFKDWDSTIHQNKSFQRLTILAVKKTLFSCTWVEFPIFQVVLIVCPVPGHRWKTPSFLMPPMRYLCTVLRSPWAFSSPHCTGSALLASLCMSDASGPSLPPWPFFGLSPVCPCILLGSPEPDPALQMCLTIGNASSQTGWQRGKTIPVTWRCFQVQELPLLL